MIRTFYGELLRVGQAWQSSNGDVVHGTKCTTCTALRQRCIRLRSVLLHVLRDVANVVECVLAVPVEDLSADNDLTRFDHGDSPVFGEAKRFVFAAAKGETEKCASMICNLHATCVPKETEKCPLVICTGLRASSCARHLCRPTSLPAHVR